VVDTLLLHDDQQHLLPRVLAMIALLFLLVLGCGEPAPVDPKGSDSSESGMWPPGCVGQNSSYWSDLYYTSTQPHYYRDNPRLEARWLTGIEVREEISFQPRVYGDPLDVEFLTFQKYPGRPDTIQYWIMTSGALVPDAVNVFFLNRCEDPASGEEPEIEEVALLTSELGTSVPAELVDGSTWAMDAPFYFQEFAFSKSLHDSQRDEPPTSGLFPGYYILLRIDAPSDDLPATVSMGFAKADSALGMEQDLCIPVERATLERPWGEDPHVDPHISHATWAHTRAGLQEAFEFVPNGTIDPTGTTLAEPRVRAMAPEGDAGAFGLPGDNCNVGRGLACPECPDGSGRLCLPVVGGALSSFRSPIPLVDRSAEEIALDPACAP
jgi:hypothetical protein